MQFRAHSSKTDLQAFSAYSRIFLGRTASKQREFRKQVLQDKAELAKTSSQDQFAKWAKLKRKVDKGLADLEKLSEYYGSAWLLLATVEPMRCRGGSIGS